MGIVRSKPSEEVRLAGQTHTSQAVVCPGAAPLLARLAPDRWAIVISNDHAVLAAADAIVDKVGCLAVWLDGDGLEVHG